MPFVLYAAPFFTVNALRFLRGLTDLPEVRVGLITQEPLHNVPAELQARLAGHYRVENAFQTQQLLTAARFLINAQGPAHRFLAIMEQVQVQVAEAREILGIEGMSAAAARRFRDKALMKKVLRDNQIPCARYCLVTNARAARDFAGETGFPLVVKPPEGAGAASTFRVDAMPALEAVLKSMPPDAESPLLLEEFITGEEHSFDTFSLRGRPLFHTLTHYAPTPLEVLQNSWIQWTVLLPREVNDRKYDDIRRAAFRALEVLGMQSGMSHMEWFRRNDGSLAISEVGARPPGAQITTLISRACDFDAVAAWARLMVFEEFDVPVQKYAAGIAYLRGQGSGRIRAIHGLDAADREVGHLVTDVKLPESGHLPTGTYEGDGYVILRHPRTAVVKEALQRLISLVRVELG